MKFFKRKEVKVAGFLLAALVLTSNLFSVEVKAEKVVHKDTGKLALYQGKPVKYVFFMIGDGMAATQINVTRKYNQKPLTIDSLPVKGLTYTSCQNYRITDSAAAATAMACGKKTAKGMLGVDVQGNKLLSVAAKAKKYSKRKVGIISSVSLNHATPSGFYANENNRGNYYKIGLQLAKSNYDFFGGGGINKNSGAEGSVYDVAQKNGFKFVNSKAAFDSLKKGEYKKVLAVAPRINGDGSLPKSIDQREGDISLAQFTQKAIDLLDNENGFFLMVEGGQIDWSCHENDGATVIKELLAFDDAVKVALDFAKKHPKETLIVVGGDHETGGMKMGLSGTQFSTYRNVLSKQKVSTKIFNRKFGQLVSSLKYSDDKKVMNEQFASKVMPLVKECFGLDFSMSEKQVIKDGFIASMKKRHVKGYRTPGQYGWYDPITVAITHTINQRAGVTWSSFNHTATPTSVFAFGEGSDIFKGEYQNTGLALKLMSIIGVPAKVEYK